MPIVAETHMDPVNGAVRFVAELVALYGIGAGLWATTDSVVVTVLVPLAAMVVWGVFRVPDDPGPAPVAVPGLVRLVIEDVVFIGGTLGLWAAHGLAPALTFATVVAVHYATTLRRLRHLLAAKG